MKYKIGRTCYLKSDAIEQATQQPLNGMIVKITDYAPSRDEYIACIDWAKKTPCRFVIVSPAECDFDAWDKIEKQGWDALLK